jgi:hypothetical protein
LLLPLLVLALVVAALTVLAVAPAASRRMRERNRARRLDTFGLDLTDPGRERRAEQRARELLRSCVNAEEWGMYRDLGFIRVHGGHGRPAPGALERARFDVSSSPRSADTAGGSAETASAEREARPAYAYLIYPHKPIVAYVPSTGRLLSEYCVEFPDLTGAITRSRLPDSDDVLAKWMALTGDERRLIRSSNMHLPGRQVDPARVRRDLWRLAQWERQRGGSDAVEARRA